MSVNYFVSESTALVEKSKIDIKDIQTDKLMPYCTVHYMSRNTARSKTYSTIDNKYDFQYSLCYI